MIYPVKTPAILPKLYPSLIWNMSREERVLYLTFDDGPSPEITEKVINILDKYNVKACFFLIGDKVNRYPELFKLLQSKGHQIGNHTYNHLNGWRSSTSDYLANFKQCEKLVDSNLFRPPYGRIKSSQIKALKEQTIIMWDVLSGDFDSNLTPKGCLKNLTDNVENGSIIVMHDSKKSEEKVLYALPIFLDWAKKEGYTFGLF